MCSCNISIRTFPASDKKSYGYLVTLCHTPADAAITDTFLAMLAIGPLPEDAVFK